MPPVKSIRYFNNYGEWAPWVFSMWDHRNGPMKRRWRKVFPEMVKGRHLNWYLRYFFLKRSDQWYLSLFQPDLGQLSGEVCHAYGGIDSHIISNIATLLPDVKIIYLIRNPVERLWSEANLYFRRRGEQIGETTDDATVMEVLNELVGNPRSDALAKLLCWQTSYPKEQFFVGFFDQLREQPSQLLCEIHQFIGVSADKQYIPDQVDQRIGSSPYMSLPHRFAKVLARTEYQRIEALHQHFDNRYTAQWLQECKEFYE